MQPLTETALLTKERSVNYRKKYFESTKNLEQTKNIKISLANIQGLPANRPQLEWFIKEEKPILVC